MKQYGFYMVIAWIGPFYSFVPDLIPFIPLYSRHISATTSLINSLYIGTTVLETKIASGLANNNRKWFMPFLSTDACVMPVEIKIELPSI